MVHVQRKANNGRSGGMQSKVRRHAREGQKAYKRMPEGIQWKARRHAMEGQKSCK